MKQGLFGFLEYHVKSQESTVHGKYMPSLACTWNYVDMYRCIWQLFIYPVLIASYGNPFFHVKFLLRARLDSIVIGSAHLRGRLVTTYVE